MGNYLGSSIPNPQLPFNSEKREASGTWNHFLETSTVWRSRSLSVRMKDLAKGWSEKGRSRLGGPDGRRLAG